MFAGSALTSSAAVVIAGWDNWDSGTAPSSTVVATGVTATAATSSTIGDWTHVETDGRGSSLDGTWGTEALGTAPSTVTTGSANLSLTNGKPAGDITITIVNNGATSIILESFNFDAIGFRPSAALDYVLEVETGSDITIGAVTGGAGSINHLGGGLITDDAIAGVHDQHDDIDIDLSGLTDATLDVGETAIFKISFSGSGNGGNGGHHLFLDNLAVGGTIQPIPEPSAFGLLALSAGGFFLRRRRS